jgi:hypothetical protein
VERVGMRKGDFDGMNRIYGMGRFNAEARRRKN